MNGKSWNETQLLWQLSGTMTWYGDTDMAHQTCPLARSPQCLVVTELSFVPLSFTQLSPTSVLHPGVTHQLSFSQVSPTSCLSRRCHQPMSFTQVSPTSCLSRRCHPPMSFTKVSPTNVFNPGITPKFSFTQVSCTSCLSPRCYPPVSFTQVSVQ